MFSYLPDNLSSPLFSWPLALAGNTTALFGVWFVPSPISNCTVCQTEKCFWRWKKKIKMDESLNP
jgi:hypothetical protein